MSLKSKEARFIFVPEVQDVTTTFTYNFFERDERDPENESGRLEPDEIDESKLKPKRFKFNLN